MDKDNCFPFGISKDKKVKLFCFPHAGGSANTYRSWMQFSKNTDIEVIPVEYPGRFSRLNEQNMESVRKGAKSIAESISDFVCDAEYVLYGHSFGSLMAFQTEVELEKKYLKEAKALIVSGRPAPYHSGEGYKTEMGEEALVTELRRMKYIDEAILNNKQYLDFFLPIIMNDYRLNERYKYENERIVANLIAFSSYDDIGAEPKRMEEWKNVTVNDFKMISRTGGHFFVFEEGEKYYREVIDSIDDMNKSGDENE